MSLDLRYGEVEEQLRASVRALLADHCAPAAVLAGLERSGAPDPRLWRLLAADLGLSGLAVPESLGGAGAGACELAVVLEELGRAAAPVPFLGTAGLAVAALTTCAEVPEAAELLARIAGGAVVALAVPFSTAPGSGLTATVAATGNVLAGPVTSVADALGADVLLVPAATGLQSGLYAVDAAAAGVRRTAVVSLDQTRPLCDLTLSAVPARPLALGATAARAVEAALVTGAALLASEQLGTAQWCLDATVEHLRTRRQFGRVVGSYQAIKHRLADLWVELAQGRAVARYAAACAAANDPDAPVAAALAQAHCSPLAVRAAEECVQLHGGIGFTWEHPAHVHLKRARSAALALGGAGRHRARLAELVDLPPS
ncbi:acyl-CoA dehydrogenase family protein [Catellatospora sp. KI3]|uniref:acyl-CoA dehydrogenase family protein n=1 Tax=Catellatospora sp. KI3 TaxID=3041620 RepID=UPI00248211E7|nr:acyl-CoA dehydrogenase family protein [Catellatospora sp. KI3]MDI1463833.1 acyl-CoA dehydrogenase family protein [Catellatospora sp. KI3]